MKKVIGLLVLSLALFHTTAKAEMIEGVEVSRSAQAINFTQSIDMSKYRTAGVQAVYSDGTPSADTVRGGNKQTGTITVGTNSSQLISAQASVTVEVRSTSTVTGDSVTLNGIVFTEGVHWTSITSTSTAATNLKNVVDAHPDFVATVSGSTVTVKYVTYGTAGNGLPVATSDAANLVIGGSTFTSGVNQHLITINGTALTEGVDFNAHSSTQTTAHNIVTAINANSTLNAQVISSSSSAVVTITALQPGKLGYYMSASTSGFIVSNFTDGTPSDISLAEDEISGTAHGLTTGLKVLFSTVAASTPPGGLTNQTTYYAIKVNDDVYQLATSSTNAVAGTAIDITSLPTTGGSYTFTPLALSVGAGTGFYWQASNDNSNFSNLSISSVTYSAAGNTLWDLGEFAYRYLRMVFTGPTNGGLAVSVRISGREE